MEGPAEGKRASVRPPVRISEEDCVAWVRALRQDHETGSGGNFATS